MSGVLVEEQLGWLRRKATVEGQRILASICQSSDSRIWHTALRCIPDKIEIVVADAVALTLVSADSIYELQEIAERLANDGFLSQLERLSVVSDEFAETVKPYLAIAGEESAIDAMLDLLLTRLQHGPAGGEHGDLSWLSGIRRREQFLDKLFECLLSAYPRESAPVPARQRPRGARGVQVFSGAIWDPLTPLTSAIRDIGGQLAIQKYDDVLANEEGVAFLRLQRDAIADAELSATGIAASGRAIRMARLPYTPR